MKRRTTQGRFSWFPRGRTLRNIAIAVAILAVLVLGIGIGAWSRVCAGNACPSIAGIEVYNPEQAAKVYAGDGRLITDLGTERRTVVPLDQMAPAVKAAFIATEDKRFYSHDGIDFWRVFGAAKDNILERRIAGGFSTITMQLARNLWPEDINFRDRSLSRKLREMKVALEIERRYPKDKILELYLNQIELGNRAFGAEAAAQRYFGKSVRNLNVAEAAMLAALPKAPTRYNPRRYPRRAVQRRNTVINLMRDEGYLTSRQAEKWKAYPVLLSSRSDFSEVAPYFVEYVRQMLDAQFGSRLYREGLRIYTTLDLDMQQSAERALNAQLDAIEGGQYGKFSHETYREYIEKKEGNGTGPGTSPYLQGMAIILDARTGQIRAMVGGRDFDDSKFNRATQAQRQPGSTFKPFVYSAALRAGFPLSQILADEPISLPGDDSTAAPWEPQNFDLTFQGPMTMRRGLYLSRNAIAVRVGLEVGVRNVIAEATNFGITSTRIPPYPSIFIGSAEVVPLDITSAYIPFATLGIKRTPVAIDRVEDKDGHIIWRPTARAERVMDEDQGWLMTDALRDVVRHGTAYSSVTAQGFTVPAGGKTGTTNDYADVWFIGFTPELVGSVWLGFDQRQRIMNNAQGGRLAAPVWTSMMKEIYDRRPTPPEWRRPDGLTVEVVDSETGYKYTPFCPPENRYVESYIPGTEPREYCPIHSPFAPAPGASGPVTFPPGPRNP